MSALSAAGVDPGVVALTLQPDLPMWWLVHLAYSFGFGALCGAVAYRGRLRDAVGSPVGPLVGHLVGPLVGHLVYGGLLGGLYPLARRYV